MVDLPLSGVRVLDLTRVLSGPFCTLQLADLGADVIKVEQPVVGDDARRYGPYVDGTSAYYLSLNRNKRSITINLRQSRGQELVRELARRCDVLVENFRPGTMDSWQLGYEDLKRVNPALVYASISGFGATGPDASRAAYDLVVQARGGIMSLTGPGPGQETRVGVSIGDLTAGLMATIGILAAVCRARATGQGERVDVSMLDAQVAMLENAIARYSVTGEVPVPVGNRHPSVSPFSALPAGDGMMVVAVGNDRLWRNFCGALDRNDLVADPRFADNDLRTEHWDELREIIAVELAKRPVADWLAILDRHEVPCARVQDVPQVVSDPQVRARDMIVNMQLPAGGSLLVAGIPYKLSSSPCTRMQPAPGLGEHTEEVLAGELGLTRDEIETLEVEGVI